MKELLRTSDPVLLSFVEMLLKDDEVVFFVADKINVLSSMDPGTFAHRVLVDDDDFERAGIVLKQAGLEANLSRP